MRKLPDRWRPPYLHKDGCPRKDDYQIGRWLEEQRTGDHGAPPLYCTEPGHDHGKPPDIAAAMKLLERWPGTPAEDVPAIAEGIMRLAEPDTTCHTPAERLEDP